MSPLRSFSSLPFFPTLFSSMQFNSFCGLKYSLLLWVKLFTSFTTWQVTMEGFTEKVVNPMKSLDLYESRGSPIMLSKLFRIGPSHLCQANSRFGICSGEVRRKWRFIRQPPHGIQHSRFIIEQEIKINEAQKHWASFCCDATKI